MADEFLDNPEDPSDASASASASASAFVNNQEPTTIGTDTADKKRRRLAQRFDSSNSSDPVKECLHKRIPDHRFHVIVVVLMVFAFLIIFVSMILVIGATRPSNPAMLPNVPPATLPPTVSAGFLPAPMVLYPGAIFFSPKYQASMVFSDDLYVNRVGTFKGAQVWSAKASIGGTVRSLLLQTNGLLSILNEQGTVIWTTGVFGEPDNTGTNPYGLFVMDNANLIVAKQSETSNPSQLPTVGLWTSATSDSGGKIQVLDAPFSLGPDAFRLVSSSGRYQAVFTSSGFLQVQDTTQGNVVVWQAPPSSSSSSCTPTKVSLLQSGVLLLLDSSGTACCWNTNSANLNVLSLSLSESFSLVLSDNGALQILMTSAVSGAPVQTLIWSSNPAGETQSNPFWSVTAPWSGSTLLLPSPLSTSRLVFGSDPSAAGAYTQGVLMFYSESDPQGVPLSLEGGKGSTLSLLATDGSLEIRDSAGALVWSLSPSSSSSPSLPTSALPVTLGCLDTYLNQEAQLVLSALNAVKGSSFLWSLPSYVADTSATGSGTGALSGMPSGFLAGSRLVSGDGAALPNLEVYLTDATAGSPYGLVLNSQTNTFGVTNIRAITPQVASTLTPDSAWWAQKQVFTWASSSSAPRVSWLSCGLLSLVSQSDPAVSLWDSGTAELSQTAALLSLKNGLLQAFWGAAASGAPFWLATSPLTNVNRWSYSSALTVVNPNQIQVWSVNKAYVAIFQGDGNFVLKNATGSVVYWSSGTGGQGHSLTLSAQGELSVANAAGLVLWQATPLPQSPLQAFDFPVILSVSNDGFLQLNSANMAKADTPVWKINGQVQLEGDSKLSSASNKTFNGSNYPMVLLSSSKKTGLFYLPTGALEIYPILSSSGMLGTRIWSSTQQPGQGQLAPITGTPGFTLQLTSGGDLISNSPGGQVAWSSQSANNFDPGSPFILELCDNGFLHLSSSLTTTNPDASVWFSVAPSFQVGVPRQLSLSGVMTQDAASWFLVSPNSMYKVTLDTTKNTFVLSTTDPTSNSYSCSSSSSNVSVSLGQTGKEEGAAAAELTEAEAAGEAGGAVSRWGRRIPGWSFSWRYCFKRATKPRWKVHQRLVVQGSAGCRVLRHQQQEPKGAKGAKGAKGGRASSTFHFSPQLSVDGKSLLIAYLTDTSNNIHPLIQTLASTSYTPPLTLALSNSSDLNSSSAPLLYVVDAKDKLIATYPQDLTMPTQILTNTATPLAILKPEFSLVSVSSQQGSFVLTFEESGILQLFSNQAASHILWSSTLPSSGPTLTQPPELVFMQSGALFVMDPSTRQNLWNSGSGDFNSVSSSLSSVLQITPNGTSAALTVSANGTSIWSSASFSVSSFVPSVLVGSSWQSWTLPSDSNQVINLLCSTDHSMWLIAGYDPDQQLPFVALTQHQSDVSGNYLWSSFQELVSWSGKPSYPTSSYTHTFVFNQLAQAQLWATPSKGGEEAGVLVWQSSLPVSSSTTGPFLLYLLNAGTGTGTAVASRKLVCSTLDMKQLWVRTQPSVAASSSGVFVGPASSNSSNTVSYAPPQYISSPGSSQPHAIFTVTTAATLPLSVVNLSTGTTVSNLPELTLSANYWNKLLAATAGGSPLPPYSFVLDKRGNCWLQDSQGRTLWSSNTGQPTSVLTLPVSLKITWDNSASVATLGLYDTAHFQTSPYWSLQATPSSLFLTQPTNWGGSFSSPCQVIPLSSNLGPNLTWKMLQSGMGAVDNWIALLAVNNKYLSYPWFAFPALAYVESSLDLQLTASSSLQVSQGIFTQVSQVTLWSSHLDGIGFSTSTLANFSSASTLWPGYLRVNTTQELDWGYSGSGSSWTSLWKLQIAGVASSSTPRALTSSLTAASLWTVANTQDQVGANLSVWNFSDTNTGETVLSVPPLQLSSGRDVLHFPNSPYYSTVTQGKASFSSLNVRIAGGDPTKPILSNDNWMVCVSTTAMFCWQGTSPPTSATDMSKATWQIPFTTSTGRVAVYLNWRGNFFIMDGPIAGSDAPPATVKPYVLWSSQTAQMDLNMTGAPDPRLPFSLVLTASGRLRIRDAQNRIYWSSPPGTQSGVFPPLADYSAMTPTVWGYPWTCQLFPMTNAAAAASLSPLFSQLYLPNATLVSPMVLVWSSNGRYLMWNRDDGSLCIWDSTTQKESWISSALVSSTACSPYMNLDNTSGQLVLKCNQGLSWTAGNPTPSNYRVLGSYYPLMWGVSNNGLLLLYDSLDTPVPIFPSVARVSVACSPYDPWPKGWPLTQGGTMPCSVLAS